ncbi:Gfo/Idh/MocA family oxidoreductase [Jiella mangrovi]|uniref:Gfo/Idh/MocA family oxidoreductase n=1 Tax=Jiella mangrovi TaxID=2821407 RepID=A0ABS4BIU1_9HYPH|nr:Gfo/Idh/MocA family oxidoreductase [Jiella mangrovi]MBP0616673.1 Gfo/Idh/MocA family oxidoreductase [Jiella mangrovi]
MGRFRPQWLVVGSGRWGGIVAQALERCDRTVLTRGGFRVLPGEAWDAYQARCAERIRETGAEMVWIATPPGEHVVPLLEAALAAGCNAVVEKPWLTDSSTSSRISKEFASCAKVAAVHHQYLYLDDIEALRERWQRRDDALFAGAFLTTKPGRPDLPADANLGSHLLSMRRYIAPSSQIAKFDVGYGQAVDLRKVCFRSKGQSDGLDFTVNSQPIVERFIADFERSSERGTEPPANLGHAAAVFDDLLAVRAGKLLALPTQNANVN